MAEDISLDIPKDLLREVVENTEKARENRDKRKRYPSNKDIERAITMVTGGSIHRDLLDYLYEEVLRLLREKGFEPRHVSEKRLWRIVASMVEKKRLRLI